MAQISWLITFLTAIAAVVATMGIGAFLLRNAVKDVSDIVAMLPTRSLKEDTQELREANRASALRETLWVLAVRSAPGSVLVILGAVLLAWLSLKHLPSFRM